MFKPASATSHLSLSLLATACLGVSLITGCAARAHRHHKPAETTRPCFIDARPQSANPSSEKPLRFICITTCVNEPFFATVAQGANDAAKQMNVHCDFVGTQGVDIPAQVELVRKAIADNYDGIAINIIDATAFNDVIAQAQTRGIPVVAFNVNGQPNSHIPTVGQNLYEGGKSAGQAILARQLIAPASQVVITGHDGEPQAVDRRTAGIRDSLKPLHLDWHTLAVGGTAEDVCRTITRYLQANPSTKVVIATGQTNAEGAGLAIERSFTGQDYSVIAFDISPEITRLMSLGIIQLTVDQQPYAQGFYPIVQLTLAHRHAIHPGNIDTGARIILPAPR